MAPHWKVSDSYFNSSLNLVLACSHLCCFFSLNSLLFRAFLEFEHIVKAFFRTLTTGNRELACEKKNFLLNLKAITWAYIKCSLRGAAMAKSHARTNIKWSHFLRYSHLPSSCRPENIFVTDNSGIDSAYPCWSHKLFENDKRKHDFSSRSVERTLYNRHSSTLHNACLWPCRHKSSKLRLHHRRLHKKNEIEHG